MLIHILIQKRNINGNVNVNVIFNVIFFTLRFFVFYPLWRHSSLFLNKHVVFTSFVHPHSKTKQTHVNFSSFESLIRPLSHQHHSAIYTFYNHESPLFTNQQKKKKNKIKRIITTAIWCPKHHSTYLSSTYRFYVVLLPAPKTTITLLPKIDQLCDIDWLPIIDRAHYNIWYLICGIIICENFDLHCIVCRCWNICKRCLE